MLVDVATSKRVLLVVCLSIGLTNQPDKLFGHPSWFLHGVCNGAYLLQYVEVDIDPAVQAKNNIHHETDIQASADTCL